MIEYEGSLAVALPGDSLRSVALFAELVGSTASEPFVLSSLRSCSNSDSNSPSLDAQMSVKVNRGLQSLPESFLSPTHLTAFFSVFLECPYLLMISSH